MSPGRSPVPSIPDNNITGISRTFSLSSNTPLEEILVHLNITHTYNNDIEVYLTSPSNTKIKLLSGNNGAKNYDIREDESSLDSNDYAIFRLTTVGLLDENSYGTWNIEIRDINSSNNQTNRTVKAIKTALYGTANFKNINVIPEIIE